MAKSIPERVQFRLSQIVIHKHESTKETREEESLQTLVRSVIHMTSLMSLKQMSLPARLAMMRAVLGDIPDAAAIEVEIGQSVQVRVGQDGGFAAQEVAPDDAARGACPGRDS